MLTDQAKTLIDALDSRTPQVAEADLVLTLVSKINIVLRHSEYLTLERAALLGKLRDRLIEMYQTERAESARFSLAFISAERLLKNL